MSFKRNAEINYFGFLYFFGGLLQFILSCAAMGTPHFIAGEFTMETVEKFANSINTLSINMSLGTHVHAEIGIFQTVVNGVTKNENREGFKPMLGFLLVSIINSFGSIVNSIPIIYPNWRRLVCLNKYNKRYKAVPAKNKGKSEKSHAKNNFSTGMSTFVVLSLFYFIAAENFLLLDFGFSFYILLVSGILSILQGIISWQHARHNECMHDEKKKKNKLIELGEISEKEEV